MKTSVHFITSPHVRERYKTNGTIGGTEETFEVLKHQLAPHGCHM